ncbi:alkaline phosphatase-like isoform X1 [Daphnia pulicaria]|uniref:alkaline phosphatase-like isoform X1 n=1 Tax=Daphnia pulicaria TaxID=35523 RepID=UPI001EEB1924|nr:alkaline phosphatase-like isoform X1 [Daphnia pulicaria]
MAQFVDSEARMMYSSKMILLAVVLALLGVAHGDGQHRDNTARAAARAAAKSNRAVTEDAAYWNQLGQQLLLDELGKQRINSQAKNIIFFLGDGMSISTVTAARIYKGQKAGKTGEEEQLTFDRFPYTALSRTYCTDAQVADSACTATAYLTGVKTDTDTIGIDANVEFNNCTTQLDPAFHVDSVMAWAQAANKATGIVTTTRVTHATPAGTYAHVANRDWEDDYAQSFDGVDSTICDDIAEQLVLSSPGKNFKVILGGGRAYFTPRTMTDIETGAAGRRRDGQDLIGQWVSDHPTGKYITSRDELVNLDVAGTDSVMGLFSPAHMEYFLESSAANNPTLEEMTRTAIQMLQKDANGYVLLVEGGRIDQAHHDGRAKLALEETIQFDLAVAAALNMTSRQDTLIIVTADHSHTMTINGYPERGNNLLGLSGDMGDDEKPYTTLSYANGPGYPTTFDENGTRIDLTNVDTTADEYLQPSAVPIYSETHGGDDVAIFAIGPQAHLFQGVYEQHYIAHVMAYAACVGDGLKYCDAKESSSSSRPIVVPYVLIAEFIMVWFAGQFLFRS